MSRIRTIKPEAFKSETLASVPRGLRWTFAGLWTYADDEGRARDNARLIKGEVYPLDDDMTAGVIENELCALEEIECICRYEIDGKRYFHFPNWPTHQKVNRPTRSKLPECPRGSTHGGLTEPSLNTHRGNREQGTGNREQGKEQGTRETRATKLLPTWKPNQAHRERALAASLDIEREVEKFRAHAEEKSRTAKSWNAAFTRWLINAEDFAKRDSQPNRESQQAGQSRPFRPPPHLLEDPPDGLDPQQYRQWHDGYVARVKKAMGQ